MKRLKKIAKVDQNFICDTLEKELFSHDIYTAGSGVYNNKYNKYFFKIQGDWKHDHLYATEIITNKLNEMLANGEINSFEYWGEDVIEEDGSDYYTAIHSFYIV